MSVEIFVYGVDTVKLIVLSESLLGTGADCYGYLLAGLGVGGLSVAFLVNRISAWPRLGTAILGGMAVYCLPTLLFLVIDQPVIAHNGAPAPTASRSRSRTCTTTRRASCPARASTCGCCSSACIRLRRSRGPAP